MKYDYENISKRTLGYIQILPKAAIDNLKKNIWWFTDTNEYCRATQINSINEIERYLKENKDNFKDDPFEGKILTSSLNSRTSFISCFSMILEDDVDKNGYLDKKYIHDILSDKSADYKDRGFIYLSYSCVKPLINALNKANDYINIYCRPVEYLENHQYFNRASRIEKLVSDFKIDLNSPELRYVSLSKRCKKEIHDISINIINQNPLNQEFACIAKKCKKEIYQEIYNVIYEEAINMITLCKLSHFSVQHESRIGINLKNQYNDTKIKFKTNTISKYFEIH